MIGDDKDVKRYSERSTCSLLGKYDDKEKSDCSEGDKPGYSMCNKLLQNPPIVFSNFYHLCISVYSFAVQTMTTISTYIFIHASISFSIVIKRVQIIPHHASLGTIRIVEGDSFFAFCLLALFNIVIVSAVYISSSTICKMIIHIIELLNL